MIEEELQQQLVASQIQLKLWWNNQIPKESYPNKLVNKIKFLKGYLQAIKFCKDDEEVTRILKRMQTEYFNNGRFVSKL